MKKTYYFSHDFTARSDEKIVKLMIKHGWAGYGIYWGLLEKLYIAGGFLPTDYDDIAYDLRCDRDLVYEIINSPLFIIADGLFYSESALERIELARGKSKKASLSASEKWKKYYEKKAESANASENHAVASETFANASEISANLQKTSAIKEKKRKEKKRNEIKINDTSSVVENSENSGEVIAVAVAPGVKEIKDEFVRVYIDWYVNLNGVEPKLVYGRDLKAMKEIKTYLESQVKEGNSALGAWNFILGNHNFWGQWERDRVQLNQINANLANIINQIKNGKPRISENRNTHFERFIKG